jgi:hypothetical protein
MSFTNGKPFRVTEKHMKAPWRGKTDGSQFRCYLCGVHFKEGDFVRWVYTNNIKGAGGNPFVCDLCDGPDVIERWMWKCEEWKLLKGRFWYLFE